MSNQRQRRLASALRPPWLVPPPAGGKDEVVAEFGGLWSKVFVTTQWVYVSTTGSGLKIPIHLKEVATVKAGVDPSPHDEGPLWGIWLCSQSGQELEASIARPHAARAAITAQRSIVLREEGG